MAKEKAGEIKAAVFLSNVNHIVAQRRLLRNIRCMEVELKGGSTSKVKLTEGNGETKKYNDKIPIEKLIAAENEAKYHQSEGGIKLLTKPFLKDLGEEWSRSNKCVEW